MTQLITNVHNAWLLIPAGVRVALSFSVALVIATAVALVQGYGWFFPGSTDALKGEALAFITYAVPILAVLVAQLVRSQIAPAVVTWFLSTFGYQTVKSAPAAAFRALPNEHLLQAAAWVKAA